MNKFITVSEAFEIAYKLHKPEASKQEIKAALTKAKQDRLSEYASYMDAKNKPWRKIDRALYIIKARADGQKMKEIAEYLGCSVETVRRSYAWAMRRQGQNFDTPKEFWNHINVIGRNNVYRG